jgi:universal stress protein E
MSTSNRGSLLAGGIFVATDLSRASDEAVRQAHERALAAGVPLIVSFVIRSTVRYDPVLPGVRVEFEEGLPVVRSRALEAVRAQVLRCTGRKPSECEVVIGHGLPHDAIVRAAWLRQASLIVLGPHETDGRERSWGGSTVERVMRHTHLPVLVARPDLVARRGAEKRSILAATDFSDPAMPALGAAANEARRRDAKLAIVYSLEVDIAMETSGTRPLGSGAMGLPLEDFLAMKEAAQSRLQVLLERTGLDGYVVVGEGEPVAQILNAAASADADMIFVGTKGRSGLGRLMHGSVAEAVAREARCSVFVVRLETEASMERTRPKESTHASDAALPRTLAS